MRQKKIAGITFILSLILILSGSGTIIGASSVVSTASCPETLVVTVSTNDYSSSAQSGTDSAIPGTVSFGSFVGEERAINEAVKVNVKTNGQWTMQVQAEPMTSAVTGEEHIQLPAEQFQKRVTIANGSDVLPTVNPGLSVFSPFDYDELGSPQNIDIIENADSTGNENGTQVNIGLKTQLTYADLAREYQSLVTVTTTASY